MLLKRYQQVHWKDNDQVGACHEVQNKMAGWGEVNASSQPAAGIDPRTPIQSLLSNQRKRETRRTAKVMSPSRIKKHTEDSAVILALTSHSIIYLSVCAFVCTLMKCGFVFWSPGTLNSVRRSSTRHSGMDFRAWFCVSVGEGFMCFMMEFLTEMDWDMELIFCNVYTTDLTCN